MYRTLHESILRRHSKDASRIVQCRRKHDERFRFHDANGSMFKRRFRSECSEVLVGTHEGWCECEDEKQDFEMENSKKHFETCSEQSHGT